MRIYLIGYMGSGKTSLGKKLASKLNITFVDLDAEIEKANGQTINNIFNANGESSFREMERKSLHQTTLIDNAVIATGGGTSCFYNNMAWMNEHGITVYLKMNAGALYHRVGPNKHKRPLLKNLNDADLMEFIMQQLKEREVYYTKAKLIVEAINIKPDELLVKLKQHSQI